MKNNMAQRLLPLAAASALAWMLFFQNTPPGGPVDDEILAQEADKIVELCAKEKALNSCYDREIPKLMEYLSMEDTFKVTALVQKKDRRYAYCHTLGHFLSAAEVKKNPDGWKDVVARCPVGMCSDGCLHGGFQQRFASETLTDKQLEGVKPDLADICEKNKKWDPAYAEQIECYHGLGHLVMHLTGGDIEKSLDTCEEIAIKPDGRNHSQSCFDGVWMLLFRPLFPEEFALVEGKEVEKEELYSYCRSFEYLKGDTCWLAGWPLYREELQIPQGLVDFCERADLEGRERCYRYLTNLMVAQQNLNAPKIFQYCSGLPVERRSFCLAHAASRLVQVDYRNSDKSVEICSRASEFNEDEMCFDEIVQETPRTYHPGSEQFNQVCQGLPDPWKQKCLNQKE